MKTQRRRGFTVVELVVVIAIIAVLAAVLIPTFASIIKKANESAYLQERTNQQIADLAEKVEKINYFTWEDFEKKLAEELAKVGSTDTEAIQKAVDAAIAKYSDSSQTGNTGLTETQVKKIVEEAMKGQLTTAQVEAIVRQVLSGTTVSEETIRTIVNNAVKGMSTTGVTKAQVEQAVKAAISGTIAVNDEQLETAVTNALKAFGVSTITDQKVEEIVSNLKNVITINEEAGFSAATNTGSYAIDEDDANKVYYLVTDAALNSFTITGSTDATTIIIDAPNIKDVTIEGNAKVLRVLRTADESTHIKGTVTTLEVNSGRVVIEANATVGTIKAAPAKQATVTIVLENGSKVTDLNSEFQYYAGTNDYIKIIAEEGATIENSFITSSSAVTTSTTTNVELSGSAFVDTTTETATLKVKNESGVSADIKVNDTTYTSDGETSDLMLFAGGTGTEADPYLISSLNQMKNIGKIVDETYFRLVSNIVDDDDSTITISSAVIDLNGFTINIDKTNTVFYVHNSATIKNGTLNYLKGTKLINANGDVSANVTLKFDNLVLSGDINVTAAHYGPLVQYLYAASYKGTYTLNANNVINNMHIVNTTGDTGGMFGYIQGTKISASVTNCTMNGSIQGNNVGGFFNTCSYPEAVRIVNSGNILNGSLLGSGNVLAFGLNGNYDPDGDSLQAQNALVSVSEVARIAKVSENDSLISAENIGDEIKINHSNNAVSYYLVEIEYWVNRKSDGSGGYPRTITKKIDVTNIGEYNTGFFKNKYEQVSVDTSGENDIVYSNGNCKVWNEGDTYKIYDPDYVLSSAKSYIRVYGYKGDGTLITYQTVSYLFK